MDEIVSNYPAEGPIMRLTFVGYTLMMGSASHLHSIKLIELQGQSVGCGGDGWILFL